MKAIDVKAGNHYCWRPQTTSAASRHSGTPVEIVAMKDAVSGEVLAYVQDTTLLPLPPDIEPPQFDGMYRVPTREILSPWDDFAEERRADLRRRIAEHNRIRRLAMALGAPASEIAPEATFWYRHFRSNMVTMVRALNVGAI